MPKHADDDPVMVGYSSSRNRTFSSEHGRGPEELGVTWGEWREMSKTERNQIMAEYLNTLVDVWVEEDEE